MKKTLTPFFVALSIASFAQNLDFEQGGVEFTVFDGASTTIVANPLVDSENESDSVAKVVKGPGQIWAGSLTTVDPLDFSYAHAFRMKVLSPRADVPVLFKLEGSVNPVEKIVNTTTSGQWETMTFDFAGTQSGVYDKLVFMFDFGAIGDSTENFTFYFDDVHFHNVNDPILTTPEFNSSQLKLYPVPASKQLTIEGLGLEQVTGYDLSGKMLFTQELHPLQSNQIDLPARQGALLLEIFQEGALTREVILQQ